MPTIRVANLPKAKDGAALERQVNREELDEGREVTGLGLDNTSNVNFIEFKSNRSAAKLERLRVRMVPAKARTDTQLFREFITPLTGDGALLERSVVLLDGTKQEVVMLRHVPAPIPPVRLPAPASSGPRTTALEFVAAKRKVHNRIGPPDSFLNELVAWGRDAEDEIFETPYPHPTPHTGSPDIDIYEKVKSVLGPYRSLRQRRAVMLEVMRVLAGFESSWKWNEGRDTSNPDSNTPTTTEAGAFQVSADSLFFGRELKELVQVRAGNLGPVTFQKTMKADHTLAMEYIARLLRHTDRHHGPMRDGHINRWLQRDAVREFQDLL